jgi:hypothetical protein
VAAKVSTNAFGAGGAPHFAADGIVAFRQGSSMGFDAGGCPRNVTTPDYPFSLEIPPLFATV